MANEIQTVNGIKNDILGKVLFNPAPHSHYCLLNNIQTAINNVGIYAPNESGIKGLILMSTGEAHAPVWMTPAEKETSLFNTYNCFFKGCDKFNPEQDCIYLFVVGDIEIYDEAEHMVKPYPFIDFLKHLVEISELEDHVAKLITVIQDNSDWWNMPGDNSDAFKNVIKDIIDNFQSSIWSKLYEESEDLEIYQMFFKQIDYYTYIKNFGVNHTGWYFDGKAEYLIEFIVGRTTDDLPIMINVYKCTFNEENVLIKEVIYSIEEPRLD